MTLLDYLVFSGNLEIVKYFVSIRGKQHFLPLTEVYTNKPFETIYHFEYLNNTLIRRK